MRKLFSDTSFDFVDKRRIAYLATAIIFGLGLVVTLVRGVNLSIEFTGGTTVHFHSSVPVDVARIREAVEAQGISQPEIKSFGAEGEYEIRARSAKEGSDADNTELTTAAVRTALADALGGADNYRIVQAAAVGPKVGGELRNDAIRAILIAFVLVLGYLAYRFEWRFGVAAVAATAHDVIGTVLFVGAMNFEVSLVIVGGVLSVLGLSMNETIVIFDRVRENERNKVPGTLTQILNLSINETLPRTVITHGTSLATMLTLVLFGGEVIRPFALVMFWGVGTGLFSSMYIAPAILLYIRERWPMQPTTQSSARRPVVAKRPGVA